MRLRSSRLPDTTTSGRRRLAAGASLVDPVDAAWLTTPIRPDAPVRIVARNEPATSLLGGDDEIPATAAARHGPRIGRLVRREQALQVDRDRRMLERVRQQRSPRSDAGVHRGAQAVEITGDDRVVAGPAALPEHPHPRRIKALPPQRSVPGGPRRDGNEVEHSFQPGHDLGIAGGLDPTRERPAVDRGVVVETADAGEDDADHVLRSRRLDQRAVLGRVELANQHIGITVGQSIAPQRARGGASAGRHAAPVHEPDGGLQGHDHHRSGWLGIERRHEWLIDPPAGEGEPIGEPPDDVGQRRRSRFHRAPRGPSGPSRSCDRAGRSIRSTTAVQPTATGRPARRLAYSPAIQR